MFKTLLAKVADGHDLDPREAAQAMEMIMAGEATPAQIGGFLVGLRAKGETVQELVGLVRVMREHAVSVPSPHDRVIDTCGTGGDGKGTLNVSTAAALVAAAGGATVAKHGNRSISSRCGSADLLEHWGVRIDLHTDDAAACLREQQIAFLFAPHFHPAMKHAAGPRREMGLRTVFNLLGPMTNPAGVKRQVLGVFAQAWTEPLAQTLQQLGSEHALVVCSDDGLDELSPAAPTQVSEVRRGEVHTYHVTPDALGMAPQSLDGIAGGAAPENAARIERILRGNDDPAVGAVAINAGAALYVAGLADSLPQGVEQARAVLHSDAAWRKLQEWAAWSQSRA